MAKKVINAFNVGEVSPNVYARSDSELYDKACIKMENFIPLEYGGATRRPSTKYCYNISSKSIIIPFIFNVETSYNFLFTNENITILDSNSNFITDISSPYLESELEELKYYQSLDTLFLVHKNHEPRKIERRIVNNTDSFSFSTFDYKIPPLLNINKSDILITTSQKTGDTTLTATNDFFELNHEGSYFVFNEIRDTKNQTVDAKFNTISAQVLNGGNTESLNVSLSNWSIETLGKWSGKIVVQKSEDGGSTFEDYVVIGDTLESSGQENIKNFSFASSEPEPINTIIRARYTGGSTHSIAGASCNILLKADSSYNTVIAKINTFVSATEVTATVVTPFQETISDYNNTHASNKSDYIKGDKIQVTAPFSYSGANDNIDFANLDTNNDILNIRGCVYSGDDQDGVLYVLTDDGTASGKRVVTFTKSSGNFGNAVRNATLSTSIQSKFTLSKRSIFDIDIETISGNDYLSVMGYTRAISSSERSTYASTDYGTELKVVYFKISDGTIYPYGRVLSVSNNYSWYQGGSIAASPTTSLLFKTNCNHQNGVRTYSGDLNAYSSKFYGSQIYEDNSLRVVTDTTTTKPYNDGYPAYVDMTYISDSNTFYAIDKDAQVVDQLTDTAEYRTSFNISSQLTNTAKAGGAFFDGTYFYVIRTDGIGLQYSVGAETKYYECLKNNPTAGSFATQQGIGIWGERFPRMKNWYEGAFSKKNGFPKAVSIYENRLVFAGTDKDPNTLWISSLDDLNNFNIGSLDTDGMKITLSSLNQNDIQWLCSARNLIIGTSANEWSLGSGNQNIPISPSQFNLKRRTQYGSSMNQGILVNSSILFLMRQNKKIREWYLQDNQEDYLANDLSFIAEHITQNGINQMAVQTQPNTNIWMVRDDGILVGLTYERESKVIAWHKHTFNTNIKYLSLDGVNDYVDAPHVDFQNDEVIDFSINFKIRQTSTEREWLINQAGSFEIDIRANATNEFYLILGRGTNGTSITYNKLLQFANDFTDNQWHTLHITVDPIESINNITATIDSVSTTSTSNLSFDFSGTTFEHANQSNYNFLIGNAKSYSSPYSGNEPLYPDSNPTDTLDLDLNYATLKVGDSTKFNYLFDTGSGTTVNDISGSNNASIINNTNPTWVSQTDNRKVESVSVLPTSNNEDKVFLSVKRSDSDERDIIQLDNQNWGSTYTAEYSGLDFYKKYTNHSSQTVDGLDHLEGESVTAKVNGVTEIKTVSNGAITLDSTPSNATVYVGLPYTATLAPLYVDADGSVGSKKSVQHATIRFKDTLKAKVGQKETGTFGASSTSVLDDVKFASTTTLNNEDAEVWLANHNEFLQTVYVVSDTPQPCTVLAMVVDVEGV